MAGHRGTLMEFALILPAAASLLGEHAEDLAEASVGRGTPNWPAGDVGASTVGGECSWFPALPGEVHESSLLNFTGAHKIKLEIQVAFVA